MAVGARVRANGLGVGILLGALAMWGCGSAEDVLYTWTGFRAGDTASGVPDGGMDVPRDPGEGPSDEGGDPGWDPGIDAGQDVVEDPGIDPGTDPGVDPGQDPGGPVCPADKDCTGRYCGPDPVCQVFCGTCQGADTCNAAGVCVPSGPNCPGSKDCTGRACGPDPVCGLSCGTCVAWATCNTSGQCIDKGGCGANCGAMVTVPAGSFMQGCNEAVDTECGSNEKPYHQVTVPAFEIDKYEVTVGEYEAFVEALGTSVSTTCNGGTCTPGGTSYSSYCNWGVSGKAEHPVNCITWYQARAYCAWAGKRLCSESEWEKASRGTDGRKYPWGNETATCEYAVMYEGKDGCGTDSTWPVGSKLSGASPYGVLDLSGNVWEWLEDDYHSTYTDAPTNGSAWVDEPRASDRVSRGGSFVNFYAYYLRSSDRSYDVPAYGDDFFGARCCRSK